MIDTRLGEVRAGGAQVPLPPAERAFLLMMARAAKEGRWLECPPEGEVEGKKVTDVELARRYLAAMTQLRLFGPDQQRTRAALKDGMDKNFFERRKSNVNRALRRALGPGPAAPYLIVRRREEGRYVHGLTLRPEQIEIT